MGMNLSQVIGVDMKQTSVTNHQLDIHLCILSNCLKKYIFKQNNKTTPKAMKGRLFRNPLNLLKLQ